MPSKPVRKNINGAVCQMYIDRLEKKAKYKRLMKLLQERLEARKNDTH